MIRIAIFTYLYASPSTLSTLFGDAKRCKAEWPDLLYRAIIIKLKTKMTMQPPENVSLLKHPAPQMVEVHCNPQQLKALMRQKQAIIAEYTKKVEIKREEMKNLSKSVNSLIDKQMKKPAKERPVFHVTFNNKRLNSLQAEKNKVFAEIESVKQELKALHVDYPEAIVKEVMMGQAKMEELTSLTEKVEDDKLLITRTLEENKWKLEKLKESSCLVDLEKKEAELQQMRKECKQFQKEVNMFTAEELQRNAYYLQIKTRHEKEVVVEEKEKHVDQAELRQLVLEINQTYEERNAMEKEMTSKLKNKEKAIAELQRSIKEKQGLIRQLQNDSLRASIQSKRMKSTILLREESPTKKTIFKLEQSKQLKQKSNPQEKKEPKRIVNRIYMIQKDDANCIYVGDWQSDVKTADKPDISISTVEYVKSIMFYLFSGKVVGIKSTYIDKNGLLQQGRELVVKQAEEVQAKIEINLEDVAQLEYSTKSDDIYVRFFLANGSWKELGKRGLEVEKINLESYRFKNIEAQVNDPRTSIRGLKLSLEERSAPEKLALSDVAERTSSQMSFSPAKRKVILKGRSLKKIHEEPLVDHRLMLNKHR